MSDKTQAPVTLPLDERLKDYWNRAAATFGSFSATSRDFDVDAAWRQVLSGMLQRGRDAPPIRRVADMGTGPGKIAAMLASLGYEVIAIDFAPAMLERAREALASWPNAQVRHGNVTEPPLTPGEVDAIVGRDVLWTLPQPQAAIKTWATLVAPGGLVGVIDGTHHGYFRRFPAIYETISRLTGGKGHRISRKNNPNREVPLADLPSPEPVRRMFAEAGLRDIRVSQLTELDRNLQAAWSWLDRATYRPQRFAIVGSSSPGRSPS